jgi:hypothetical protein
VKAHSVGCTERRAFLRLTQVEEFAFYTNSPGSLIINTCLLWESWARRGAGRLAEISGPCSDTEVSHRQPIPHTENSSEIKGFLTADVKFRSQSFKTETK